MVKSTAISEEVASITQGSIMRIVKQNNSIIANALYNIPKLYLYSALFYAQA